MADFNKTDNIQKLSPDFEVSILKCPKALFREAKFVFPFMQSKAINSPEAVDWENSLIVIPTCQRAREDLVKVGPEIEAEKDRLLITFMDFGKSICENLISQGYWADYIDPCSGLPMISPDCNKVYSEVDGIQICLQYKTMNCGCCKVLLHNEWGSSVYPATVFTNAPLNLVNDITLR